MKKRFGKRIVAFLLALFMMMGTMPAGLFPVEEVKAASTTHIIDPSKDEAIKPGGAVPITEGPIGDGFFKVFGTVTKKGNSSSGAVYAYDIDKQEKAGIEFTVTGTAKVTIKVSSTGGSNYSVFGIKDANGNFINNKEFATLHHGSTDSAQTIHYDLNAGTYKFMTVFGKEMNPDSPEQDLADKRGCRLVYMEVVHTTSGGEAVRKDWSQVAAPTLGTPSVSGAKIKVPFTMDIGFDGADSVEVYMKDSTGAVVDKKAYAQTSKSGSVEFTPTKSGSYTFEITAKRANSADKKGSASAAQSFTLPLGKPNISSVTSAGGGKIVVAWSLVDEATAYDVYYKPASAADSAYKKGATANATTASATISGLTVGTEYTIKVTAVRGAENTFATQNVVATADAKRTWAFAAFGNGATEDKNSFTGDLNKDGKVTLSSTGNGGKLVPKSTDGLAFYYTKLSDKDNFVFEATVKVNSWTYTNGQDGFGIMVCDAVGAHGDTNAFWNNSIMNTATKVEYYWDDENNKISTKGAKISMKLGVGAQSKTGVPKGWTDAAVPDKFKSVMNTLEKSGVGVNGGTYNIIGNYTNTELSFTETCTSNITELRLKIIRNNTGYTCIYESANGTEVGRYTYYDQDRNDLNQIDSEYVYVGFFTARSANVTFSDVVLTTSDSATDAPAEETPVTLIDPVYTTSETTEIGVEDYEFTFVSNAEGNLKVTDSTGKEVINADLKTKIDERSKTPIIEFSQMVKLVLGENKFNITFTPDKAYQPEEFVKMSDYEPRSWSYTVTYKKLGEPGQSIYVGPSGWDKGKGTKDDPLSFREAIKYVQPGQTIVLLEGTYNVTNALTVRRGVDGTAENMIYLVADPDAKSRPVFDFGLTTTGLVFAGNYWYLKGFDVTHSKNGQKGLQISGSNCVVEQVNAYENGNTGIQISRYLVTDLWDKWPSNNLILNCTSYLNLDSGYEDADGFAAKLTIADGNVFRGCVAYNNADDGWDLFAKVETGPIGKVVIDNCIAYNNGYLLDGGLAGNGNGFKMGGESISGKHEITNSLAFGNRAKGLDSNSCPDIVIKNCTSFNNKSYNVALYTNNAANTDFEANGIISYKNDAVGLNEKGEDAKAIYEQLKLKGTQDASKVNNDTNYFHNADSTVKEDWFVSTDVTKLNITRDADGSINTNGFLQLTDKAPANAGARMTATPSGVTIVIPPSITGGIQEATPNVPATTTPEKKSSKVGLYVAIGVLAAVIVGGAAAIVVMKKKEKAGVANSDSNNNDLN